MEVGVESHASASLPPGKRHDTPRVGDCMGSRAGLDECGKSPLLPGFEPETSRSTDYAIPAHIRSHGGHSEI
jgi:hypothetical protein